MAEIEQMVSLTLGLQESAHGLHRAPHCYMVWKRDWNSKHRNERWNIFVEKKALLESCLVAQACAQLIV